MLQYSNTGLISKYKQSLGRQSSFTKIILSLNFQIIFFSPSLVSDDVYTSLYT